MLCSCYVYDSMLYVVCRMWIGLFVALRHQRYFVGLCGEVVGARGSFSR